MEIWLDTSNDSVVINAERLGIIEGVTTNPTILAQSKAPLQETIRNLLKAQKGLVAIQILADDVEGMCKQARMLYAFSNRILVKIPVTQNGICAIFALSQEGIPTLATAIFELQQALLAFKAGASYLAPYLGRIADTGESPIQVISHMHALKLQYGFKGKIMGAGIRELSTALECIKAGICAITLSEKIFTELVQDSESTLQALDKFAADWSKSGFNLSDFYS